MTKRDPNLDHPAVQLYRKYCRLQANHFQRQQIVVTVKWAAEEVCFGTEAERMKSALNHWEATLKKFMLEGNNPKRVDWIMDRFEERVRKANGQK